MSKPVLSDPFLLTAGRRNRQSFIGSLMFQAVAGAALTGIALAMWGSTGPTDGAGAFDFLVGTFLVLAATTLVLHHFAVASQRCRDCGLSGWAALALFVPVVNAAMLIALAVCAGQLGENRYGDDPLRESENSARLDALLEQAALREYYNQPPHP